MVHRLAVGPEAATEEETEGGGAGERAISGGCAVEGIAG